MKVLNPEAKGHERAASEPLWRELYESLDVVCHLQLAACPDSQEHEHESLTSPFHESLKHTYEHFSCGLTFESAEQIKLNQIASAARCFVRKEELKFDFDPERVVHGRLHIWQGRIFATTSGVLSGTVDRLRQSRGQGHAGIQRIFKRWQVEKKGFREVFGQEINSYVPLILRQYQADQQNIAKIMSGLLRGEIPSLDAILPSPSTRMLEMLKRIFEMEPTPTPAVTVKEFLESGLTSELPFNVIESLMFASLSQRAASGQKKMPDQGTLNDISVVSTLLPYCDAMFLDDGCRALLKDIPKGYKLPYSCVVFSKNNSQEFLAYLRSVRDSVTPEHLKIIEDVYGPNPLKPRGIYGVGAHRKPEHSE
ncbi:MAG TPA: hypothetical protein VJ723_05590 [Candidatus Angelobacter sp.]|nr:hypothetical protein [Candidatus Angelobacter sp.]